MRQVYRPRYPEPTPFLIPTDARAATGATSTRVQGIVWQQLQRPGGPRTGASGRRARGRSARIPLNVHLNARLAGGLRRESSGAIDFQYDESWLNREDTFPASLSLPLHDDRHVGEPVIAVFDTSGQLPGRGSRCHHRGGRTARFARRPGIWLGCFDLERLQRGRMITSRQAPARAAQEGVAANIALSAGDSETGLDIAGSTFYSPGLSSQL